jgi:hypothetical protein
VNQFFEDVTPMPDYGSGALLRGAIRVCCVAVLEGSANVVRPGEGMERFYDRTLTTLGENRTPPTLGTAVDSNWSGNLDRVQQFKKGIGIFSRRQRAHERRLLANALGQQHPQ